LNISQLGVDPDVRSPQYQAYLSNAKLIKEEKIVQIGQIYPVKPYIDNTKLNGFIDFFKNQDCLSECNNCNYCQKWADKAVSIEQKDVDQYIAAVSALLKDLKTSRIFKSDSEISAEEIPWDSELKSLMETVIQTSAPVEFKEIALMTISKLAEEFANKRGAKVVGEEDMVKAFINGTPASFQEQMRSELKGKGIEIEKFQ